MGSQSRQLDKSAGNAHLRVLVDARKILDGGIGVYTQNLVAGLLANSSETGIELALLGISDQIRCFRWSDRVAIIEDDARPYSIDEMFGLGRRLHRHVDRSSFDVFHVPHYTLPFGIDVPSVVTVHDLIHVNHPERLYYPPIAGFLLRSALKRASKVVAVSEATREDLIKFCKGTPEIVKKVSVLPNALDPYFVESNPTPGETRETFGLAKEFLLCVTSMNKPHKGLRDLIDAFHRVWSRLDKKTPDLLLVGAGTEPREEVISLIRDFDPALPVRVLGRVSKDDLVGLYSAARGVVVPSRAEGFCLPVIEAQSLGTPVIARPIPAVLELLTANDSACRDFSVESLAHEIERFLASIASSHPGSSVNSEHLKRFDCNSLGRAWSAIYQEIAVKNGRRGGGAFAEREPDPQRAGGLDADDESLPTARSGKV